MKKWYAGGTDAFRIRARMRTPQEELHELFKNLGEALSKIESIEKENKNGKDQKKEIEGEK